MKEFLLPNIICLNINDDFYEKEHLPIGEVQEAYLHIDIDIEDLITQKEILSYVLEHMNTYKLITKFESVSFDLRLYDGFLKYPKLVGTENESMLFRRYEIGIKNMSHVYMEKLITYLNNSDTDMCFKGSLFETYSDQSHNIF